MTEGMYPVATPEIAVRRKQLAPEVNEAFENFGRAVFDQENSHGGSMGVRIHACGGSERPSCRMIGRPGGKLEGHSSRDGRTQEEGQDLHRRVSPGLTPARPPAIASA